MSLARVHPAVSPSPSDAADYATQLAAQTRAYPSGRLELPIMLPAWTRIFDDAWKSDDQTSGETPIRKRATDSRLQNQAVWDRFRSTPEAAGLAHAQPEHEAQRESDGVRARPHPSGLASPTNLGEAHVLTVSSVTEAETGVEDEVVQLPPQRSPPADASSRVPLISPGLRVDLVSACLGVSNTVRGVFLSRSRLSTVDHLLSMGVDYVALFSAVVTMYVAILSNVPAGLADLSSVQQASIWYVVFYPLVACMIMALHTGEARLRILLWHRMIDAGHLLVWIPPTLRWMLISPVGAFFGVSSLIVVYAATFSSRIVLLTIGLQSAQLALFYRSIYQLPDRVTSVSGLLVTNARALSAAVAECAVLLPEESVAQDALGLLFCRQWIRVALRPGVDASSKAQAAHRSRVCIDVCSLLHVHSESRRLGCLGFPPLHGRVAEWQGPRDHATHAETWRILEQWVEAEKQEKKARGKQPAAERTWREKLSDVTPAELDGTMTVEPVSAAVMEARNRVWLRLESLSQHVSVVSPSLLDRLLPWSERFWANGVFSSTRSPSDQQSSRLILWAIHLSLVAVYAVEIYGLLKVTSDKQHDCANFHYDQTSDTCIR